MVRKITLVLCSLMFLSVNAMDLISDSTNAQIDSWKFFKSGRKWTWKNMDFTTFLPVPKNSTDLDIPSVAEDHFMTFEVVDYREMDYRENAEKRTAIFALIKSNDPLRTDLEDYYFYGIEEDGYVSMLDINTITPIYKFDMQLGEMIISKEGPFDHDDSYPGNIQRKVTMIDTIKVHNVVRQRIIFDHSDFSNDISCWIEGIGPCRENGLYYLPNFNDVAEPKLYSCYDGDKCIFTEADISAKSINENRILGENRTFSECLGFESPDDITDNQKRVKFSYENNKLDVELLSYVYSCGVRGVWPYAIVDNGQIKIVPDVEDDDADCMCHYNFSFSFAGIETGKYTVMVMSDDGKEVKDTFELDLTDGFSRQFPDEPVKIELTDSDKVSDILFDGSLVEFNAGAKPAVIEVFSTEGELMARTEGSGNVRLSTTALMPGVYIVRATTADGHVTQQRKIVVK